VVQVSVCTAGSVVSRLVLIAERSVAGISITRFAKSLGTESSGPAPASTPSQHPYQTRYVQSAHSPSSSQPAGLTKVDASAVQFVPSWPEATRPPNLVQDIHFYDLQALFSKQLGNMTANVQGLARGMFLPKALYFGRAGLKKK
jgi:hypothetical protein